MTKNEPSDTVILLGDTVRNIDLPKTLGRYPKYLPKDKSRVEYQEIFNTYDIPKILSFGDFTFEGRHGEIELILEITPKAVVYLTLFYDCLTTEGYLKFVGAQYNMNITLEYEEIYG